MKLRSWQRDLLSAALVACVFGAVAAAYRPALDGEFLWDDHVVARTAVPRSVGVMFRQPFWPAGLANDARPPYFRPIVSASYAFDRSLGGAARQFHVTNLLLHLTACALLLWNASRLGADRTVAALATLAWGLAPRLSECVAWISGRTDALACVFGLTALALSPEVEREDSRRWPLARATVAGAALLGALLAKETSLAFAIAIVVAFVVRVRPKSTAAFVRLGVEVVAPLLAYALLRHRALGGRAGATSPRHWAVGLEALGRYVEMALDPLRPATSIGHVGSLDGLRAAVGALVAVTACVLLVRFRRRLPPTALVLLALGVPSLLAACHVVPIALAGSVSADRMLYLPLAALAIGSACGISALPPRGRRASLCALVVVSGAFGVATARRCRDYESEVRYWLVAAENAHPHNVSPRMALAGVVLEAAVPDLACALFASANAVLKQSPSAERTTLRRSQENLASCLARLGKYDEGLALTTQLAEQYPESARVWLGVGYARLHAVDLDGAVAAFRRAQTLEPELEGSLTSVLEDVAMLRRRLARPPPRPRAEEAWIQSRLGHLAEAELLYTEEANDPAVGGIPRYHAFVFLVRHGNPLRAEEMLRSTPDVGDTALENHLRRRARAHRSSTALQERIARVAARS